MVSTAAAVALVAWAYYRHHEEDDGAELSFVPNPATGFAVPGPHGLILRRDSLDIVDWNAWLHFAPPLFVEAVSRGYGTSSELLAYVMQHAYPALRWPPSQDSPYMETWMKLVDRVERTIPRVAANGTPRLRLV